jgi:formamidopyrimidine-DNA glycosylase
VPELPEVETTARGLRQRLLGRRVTEVGTLDWPAMAPNASPDLLREALAGLSVLAVERRGKYVLVEMSDDVHLVFHRKMTGNLVVREPDAPLSPHTHLSIFLDGGDGPSREPFRLDFVDARKFGRVYLFLDGADLDAFLAERLGPEPLEIAAADLRRLLAQRRGRLKALLLDQRFLAGIGNLYADEILWHARLHPERAADSLTPREAGRLHAAIQDVLAAAIERRGTSLSDYVDAEGAPGENQHHLQVYGRAGQPCTRPGCGRPITRLVIAQRGTWLCLRCQALPALRSV